jgi:hypothetical protein
MKLLFLVVVLVSIIYDIHTGIILLIAFLMLMIQFNNHIFDDIRHKEMELYHNLHPASLNDASTQQDDDIIIDDNTTKLQCDNVKKNELSCNIVAHTTDAQSNVDYTVDNKIKPYEVFMKMMTSQEHLDKASNSALLQ